MRALVEEVIGAVTVAEVLKVPRLALRTSASDCILIDEDSDGSDITSQGASVLVRFGELRWCDLCVKARRFGRAMPKPLLEFRTD